MTSSVRVQALAEEEAMAELEAGCPAEWDFKPTKELS